MTDPIEYSEPFRVADLKPNRELRFDIAPDADGLAALADVLGLLAVRKLRFSGVLRPDGRHDWQIEGKLGATVVQPCVVTLEPVSTRIDERLLRRLVRDLPDPDSDVEDVEMPEDDSVEPLGEVIDLMSIAQEALSLSLPTYPRRDGAQAGTAQVAPPGQTPLSDADVKPFAGLADLKAKLQRDDPDQA
jgi:uncharacterized metal-binding protein YceD (DUF177 family)